MTPSPAHSQRPARSGFHASVSTSVCALFIVLGAALIAPGTVRADDLSDAAQLLRQKQHAQALEKVNQFLAAKPRDAQGRFLRGLILADQNKTAEAIDVFTKLTQDYPELPEPYNNLAVLYATQGQYEKARQSLEMSIRTHPSYATAYENLGDVYAKLASQAYDKALQLDSSNAAAKSKLSMVREMISSGTRPPGAASATTTTAPARPTVVAAAPKAEPAPASQPTVPPSPAAKAAPDPAPAAKAAPAAPSEPKQSAGAGNQDEVLKAVRGWAHAWENKNVSGYLAHYARDFKPPKGESRGDWEQGRRQRINAQKKIEVSVESPRVNVSGDTATVTFRQGYRSESLKINSTKTLVLAKVDGKWLIKQERVGS
jgi:tetratricopeptide (TPR) repeat protein